MLNRAQRRRALARPALAIPPGKKTHKLRPELCVVWVPDCAGYVAHLSDERFATVGHPDCAYHLSEVEAELLVQAIRQRLGLRAAIRPCYQH